MIGWALDPCTASSETARCDEATGQPRFGELANVRRDAERSDPLERPLMVASVEHILEDRRLLDRLGRGPRMVRPV
jgi:hypothetical protein